MNTPEAALLMAITLGASPSLFAQQEIGAPPGRLVDVGGGRRIHINCTGTGSPTVVLAAGASAFAIDWTLVQSEIARTNRVCSYDRAGHGWSDSTRAVETSERSVADLHAALAAAGERAPYVLVGASLAGLHIRIYELRYPNDVAGLVFVDPAHEDRLYTMFEGNAVLIASLTADQLRRTMPFYPVRVPRRSPQTGAPFDKLPRELYELRIKLDERLIASIPDVITPQIIAESQEGERAMLAELHAATVANPHVLGERPVVVLTRGIDTNAEQQAVHRSIARLSTNSRNVVVAESGHEIHLFRPAAVIDAIHDVVQSVRTKQPLRPRPERASAPQNSSRIFFAFLGLSLTIASSTRSSAMPVM
jgi:pimeloyl-ACP methyl ester carboxylesterase